MTGNDFVFPPVTVGLPYALFMVLFHLEIVESVTQWRQQEPQRYWTGPRWSVLALESLDMIFKRREEGEVGKFLVKRSRLINHFNRVDLINQPVAFYHADYFLQCFSK